MELKELAEGVHQLSRQLRSSDIPHAFGGAIAYGLYGIPRGTNDWDINVFLPEVEAKRVFDALRPIGVEVTEDAYAHVAKTGQVRLSWSGKKVDLFFAYAAFHEVVRERTRDATFEGESIFVLSGEDIIVFKVIFNRPHDWRDIQRIFQRMGPDIDLAYVTKWLSEILGADDSRIQRLVDMAAEAKELTS